MSASLPRRTQVLILGSGFAGSILATLLRRQNLDVLLVDRAVHPRFAIGESSTPTAGAVLRSLAQRYAVPQFDALSRYGTWKKTLSHLGVGKKRGFCYFQHVPDAPFTAEADHRTELMVAASGSDELSDTQWYRADVDQWLFQLAGKAGATTAEAATLVQLEAASPWQVELDWQGRPWRVTADFVVDATGAGAALCQALRIPCETARMRTHTQCIYTHMLQVGSWEEEIQACGGECKDYPFGCDDSAQHHLGQREWMWCLRFEQGVTSVGLSWDARNGTPGGSASEQEIWDDWLRRYPSVARILRNAKLAPRPGRWFRSGRLQRRLAKAVGPGWALLPHTAGFVDPLHSTGIAHSLCGVERLARCFEACDNPLAFRTRLADYEQALFRELDLIDLLVDCCYATLGDFEAFTAATMLYFAAATTYEQRRIRDGDDSALFLNADDAGLFEFVENAWRQARESGPASSNLAAWIRQGIQPWNLVGLFSPEVPNMYRYTAAE